jgi:hypothetical protein
MFRYKSQRLTDDAPLRQRLEDTQSADLVDAISRLGPQTQDVLEGFRWFGLDELASCWIEVLRLYPVDGIEDEEERDDLLETLPEDVQERCEELASRYERADATELIYAAFVAKLAVTPAALSFLDAVETARVPASNAWLSAQVREIEEKRQA